MARRGRTKYANVWWTVSDIEDAADQMEIELTRRESRRFLELLEDRLAEAAVRAGSDVITYSFASGEYESLRDERPQGESRETGLTEKQA